MSVVQNQNARVGLAVSCRRLPKLYANVNAVTSCYMNIQENPGQNFEYLGHSEVVVNNPNPSYKHVFYVDYMARRHQQVKFEIWDVSDPTGARDENATLLGSVDISLVRLVRLRGQAINLMLLDENNKIVGKGASITVRAVSIRTEKQAPKEAPPPPIPTRYCWRRVREWKWNEDDRFYDWVDIPVEEQTEEKRRKGVVEVHIDDGTTRVSDLMKAILDVADVETKADENENPNADDSSDEEEMTLARRRRKEEEMTVKERGMLKVHSKDVLDATLTVTSGGTTRRMRVTGLHETDYDPTLLWLRQNYDFGGKGQGRIMVTLGSHGFLVWTNRDTNHITAGHELLLAKLKENEEATSSQQLDLKAISSSCRHCQALINK